MAVKMGVEGVCTVWDIGQRKMEERKQKLEAVI